MTVDRAAEPAAFPLIGRADDAILFQSGHQPRTARRFLRDAQRLAASLPEADYLCNLCNDRYVFAVALAAALLRGQVSLLSSDRSPAALRGFTERFGRVASISDDPTAESPLSHHVAELPGEPVAGVPDNPLIPADRLAAIVFTSGSTGTPVGHPKAWGALASRSIDGGVRFALGEAAPASVVGTVPPQHMYGFETTLLLPLHAMASSWAYPCFYPRDIADALAAMPPPRLLVTTPLQLRALLESGMEMPSLAGVISATAPLDPVLAAEAERRWSAPVREIFGATEIGSIASRRTTEGPEWTLYDRVRLTRQEDQVVATGPFAVPHTLSDRIEIGSPETFTLVGRRSDIVKLGGRRASLAGLNAILVGIPGVRDGVFLAPDDLDRRPTARLQAFVVAPDRAPSEILDELRRRIDPVFAPRRVVLVDALPRNAVGKLTREALLTLQALRGDDGEAGRTGPRR